MRKIKVLAITEASYLDSGYAVYWRHILRELHKNENYELAEFATYVDPVKNELDQIPWKCYPNIPPNMGMEEFREWAKYPMNNFGAYLFNEVALDFRADVVLHAGDFWMQKYVNESPYRKFFKYIWLAPCDSAPQNTEWIEDMLRCDGVLTYCDWGKETIENQCPKVKVHAAAPPSCQDFFLPLDKNAVKEHFNLRPEVKFIGTVMRNQPRKMFPQLFKAYRRFLDETGRYDIYLYCHTSYPDGCWKIPELIQEYGVADRVFFTYACRGCGYVFPSLYSDIATCRKCNRIGAMMPNTMFGVPPEVLAQVYNLFDVYVQYANSEGFGLPMVEAASCGVPIMAVDYSAMSDVVRKLGGDPIKTKAMVKEPSTGAYRAVPDEDHFVDLLKKFFISKPEMLVRTLGIKVRNLFLKNYKWEESAKRWSELIDQIGPQDSLWNSPPNIHYPAQLNDQVNMMNNSDYAKWLIRDVGGQPHKLGSFTEMQLVRDLNYGMSTGAFDNTSFISDSSLFNENKTEKFDRKMAYDHFHRLGQQLSIMEQIRIQKVGLNG